MVEQYMSTVDYNRFVQLGKRLVTKYGISNCSLELISVVTDEWDAWRFKELDITKVSDLIVESDDWNDGEVYITEQDSEYTPNSDYGKPWLDTKTEKIIVSGFNCVITDYIKKYNKKGELVTSSNVAYIETSNLSHVKKIDTQSKLIFAGETWSVMDSELIRPDGKTTALIILWVNKYG